MKLNQLADKTGARRARKRVFVRSVFLQGVAHLSPDDLPPGLAGLAPALRASAREVAAWHGPARLDVAAACLLFARDRLDVPVLVGCERPAQLRANLALWSRALVAAPRLDALAGAVGTPDPALLDPSRWPTG